MDRVRERRESLGLGPSQSAPAAPPVFDPDLIPDPGESNYVRSQEDTDIDTLLDGVDIIEAYSRWCGKMEPKIGSKRESVMVSCPTPGHADKHPSAWINLDKGTWFCGSCQVGGDKYDIAAHRFGYDVPGYKQNSFPVLRRVMAEDLGYVVTPTAAGTIVSPREPESNGADEEPDPAPVLSIAPAPSATDTRIDWRSLVPPETFLHRWMTVCSKDDLPEEFYFWLGLVAVGFAAGDDVILRDNPNVKGNLFVTLYGPTGIGKTRSSRSLEEVLDKALPYDQSDPNSTGISKIASPGSGEALLDNFAKPIFDPMDPKKVIGHAQVRGLLRIDELSDLMSRAHRTGSTMKPVLMRLYDGYGDIDHSSRSYGYVRAERPFCSAVTSTQPRAIHTLLMQSDADSGFVNRWVFAMGEPKKLIAIDREPLDIDSCVSPLKFLRSWSATRRTVQLDDDARQLWEQFFTKTIEPIKVKGDESLLTRTDLTLKKIMLLFAVNEKSNIVTGDCVERVLELWPYLRDTYLTLSSQIGLGEFEDCRYRIMEFVREWQNGHGDHGPTIRDMSRRLPKQYTRKLVLDVLRNLEEMGELEAVKPVKVNAGRPGAVRYTLTG